MKTHLEQDELEFLQMLRDSDYRVDPNTYLVKVLTAKGLLFPANNSSIVLLTTRAIELLDKTAN